MNHGGFLDTPRSSPLGLGTVIALHAAALAALMLAKGELLPPPKGPFVVESWPAPKPPPPDIVIDKASSARPTSNPILVHPMVEPVEADPIIIGLDPITPTWPTNPGTVGTKEGTGIKPIPAPVTVDAQFDPRFAEALQPPYPPALMRDGVEGLVTVRILIGAEGRVKAVELVSANRPEFFEATERQATRRWRFKPATRDGVAIESWKRLTVRFTMPG